MICGLSMSGDVLVDGGDIGTTIRGLGELRRFYKLFGVIMGARLQIGRNFIS